MNASPLGILTAGASPSPILQKLPVGHNGRGAVLVDRTLGLPGYKNVWSLGDCAAVPDTEPRKTCPPTAQAATRQAAFLAKNIRASLLGRRLKPFRFQSLGSLCVVGHHTACAEMLGLKQLIDLTAQRNYLFTYDGKEYGPCLPKALVVYTRGSGFRDDSPIPPSFDHQAPYIDFWFRLIGVHEVCSVVVDNAWNQDHAQSEASLAAGKQSVERMVRGFW